MTPLPPTARVCASTGLVLLPSDGLRVWRVAKVAYGPLGPLPRPVDPHGDPASWGRFDTRGGRALYVAATRECAYAEVLAYLRRWLGQADSLAKDAAFLGLTQGELAAIIEEEWTGRGHMRPGHLPEGWRVERALYHLVLPTAGWWVLLEHPTSIAAAEAALGDSLASVGIGRSTSPSCAGRTATQPSRWPPGSDRGPSMTAPRRTAFGTTADMPPVFPGPTGCAASTTVGTSEVNSSRSRARNPSNPATLT